MNECVRYSKKPKYFESFSPFKIKRGWLKCLAYTKFPSYASLRMHRKVRLKKKRVVNCIQTDLSRRICSDLKLFVQMLLIAAWDLHVERSTRSLPPSIQPPRIIKWKIHLIVGTCFNVKRPIKQMSLINTVMKYCSILSGFVS